MTEGLLMKVVIFNLARNALETQERHHVQWYLEQILEVLGYDLEELRRQEQKAGYEWEPGIPP